MESVTKNRQPPATLRAMIARAYGEDAVPDGEDWEELGFGWFNVAYRVRLRDGSLKVLKIAPPAGVDVLAYERDAMRCEWTAIRLIAARTDVPVPEIDHADTAHDLCDADWFAMPCVAGENLAEVLEVATPAERTAHWEAVGRLNRVVNDIHGPAFGALDGTGASTWRAEFLGRIEDVLRDGERRCVDLGVPYAAVRGLIADRADSLDEVVEPRLVEWDLWPGNVLVSSGKVVALIDHERALYGDPLMESGFGGEILAGFSDAPAFRRGWGRGALVGGERTRRWLYSLHLLLVMVIETQYRGHTDPGSYAWARGCLADVVSLAPAYR